MLTIEDLKRLEVYPEPSLDEINKYWFIRGSDMMKAKLINAIRHGVDEGRSNDAVPS